MSTLNAVLPVHLVACSCHEIYSPADLGGACPHCNQWHGDADQDAELEPDLWDNFLCDLIHAADGVHMDETLEYSERIERLETLAYEIIQSHYKDNTCIELMAAVPAEWHEYIPVVRRDFPPATPIGLKWRCVARLAAVEVMA